MWAGTWLAIGVGDAAVTLASAGLEGCRSRNGYCRQPWEGGGLCDLASYFPSSRFAFFTVKLVKLSFRGIE